MNAPAPEVAGFRVASPDLPDVCAALDDASVAVWRVRATRIGSLVENSSGAFDPRPTSGSQVAASLRPPLPGDRDRAARRHSFLSEAA